jgi:hypothetical protein
MEGNGSWCNMAQRERQVDIPEGVEEALGTNLTKEIDCLNDNGDFKNNICQYKYKINKIELVPKGSNGTNLLRKKITKI